MERESFRRLHPMTPISVQLEDNQVYLGPLYDQYIMINEGPGGEPPGQGQHRHSSTIKGSTKNPLISAVVCVTLTPTSLTTGDLADTQVVEY